MDDEGLVAHVNDAADAITRVEGSSGSRIVLDCTVVVAVFYLLNKHNSCNNSSVVVEGFYLLSKHTL